MSWKNAGPGFIASSFVGLALLGWLGCGSTPSEGPAASDMGGSNMGGVGEPGMSPAPTTGGTEAPAPNAMGSPSASEGGDMPSMLDTPSDDGVDPGTTPSTEE